MKITKKNIMIVAVILIVAGIFLSFGALASMDFDFNKLNTRSFVTNTYSVDEEFTNISVEGAECDIRLLPSEDASCRVVCNEGDKISHSVTVKDNTVTIDRTDNRKWWERIGIYWGKMEIAVYLPQTEYESLYALSLSGTIDISEDFSFAEAEIYNTSGDVEFLASVKNNLKIKTVSGEVYVADTSPQNLNVQSTSGEVHVADTSPKSLNVQSTSGEVTLNSVKVQSVLKAKTVSGDINLRSCDADSLSLKSTSGEISGTLCTKKKFITDTVSGDVDVPKSKSGGKCEIKTTSGDIEFTIE